MTISLQLQRRTLSVMPQSDRKHSTIKTSLTNLLLNSASVPLGLHFAGVLNEMQRVQWLSQAELQARNESRLGVLLKHAAENVPFYRELPNAGDLKALPIFTKTDYRQCDPESLYAT